MTGLGDETSKAIESEKTELRKTYRSIRSALSDTERKRIDTEIFENLITLPEFKACHLLLSYVSVGEEVDTRWIIRLALKERKAVAVPRCLCGTDELEFYKIDSIECMVPGSFGLPEPADEPEKKVEKASCDICLLPGLAFDAEGYRLGYGRGYYDRYLEGFGGVTVGLCRSQALSPKRLPRGLHDIKTMLIVTEKEIIRP
jgi:5-formyltetrahydrofolate cyclo-ligase